MTILRAAMRPLKAEQIRRVTERFETVPGRQAQADWGECGTITIAGETRTLYLFVLVLGYSRMCFARFTTSTKQPALFRCLQGAFDALGIPTELLVDHMKPCVERHDVATSTVHWAPAFLDVAEHDGVQPLASPPYWPRVTGKVERGVGSVKHSLLEGRSFTDLDHLNAKLSRAPGRQRKPGGPARRQLRAHAPGDQIGGVESHPIRDTSAPANAPVPTTTHRSVCSVSPVLLIRIRSRAVS